VFRIILKILCRIAKFLKLYTHCNAYIALTAIFLTCGSQTSPQLLVWPCVKKMFVTRDVDITSPDVGEIAAVILQTHKISSFVNKK